MKMSPQIAVGAVPGVPQLFERLQVPTRFLCGPQFCFGALCRMPKTINVPGHLA